MSTCTITMSSAGASIPFILPMKIQSWTFAGVSLQVNFSGGGPAVGTATVQVTNDQNVTSTFPSTYALTKWNAHPVLQGVTGDATNSIGFPMQAVRLNVTSYTSGTITLLIGIPDQN